MRERLSEPYQEAPMPEIDSRVTYAVRLPSGRTLAFTPSREDAEKIARRVAGTIIPQFLGMPLCAESS